MKAKNITYTILSKGGFTYKYAPNMTGGYYDTDYIEGMKGKAGKYIFLFSFDDNGEIYFNSIIDRRTVERRQSN